MWLLLVCVASWELVIKKVQSTWSGVLESARSN